MVQIGFEKKTSTTQNVWQCFSL